jgi:hypothetical protein
LTGQLGDHRLDADAPASRLGAQPRQGASSGESIVTVMV